MSRTATLVRNVASSRVPMAEPRRSTLREIATRMLRNARRCADELDGDFNARMGRASFDAPQGGTWLR